MSGLCDTLPFNSAKTTVLLVQMLIQTLVAPRSHYFFGWSYNLVFETQLANFTGPSLSLSVFSLGRTTEAAHYIRKF
jgi:hypothetical protein